MRGVPAEGRGDSGQKTDPGFGWGPAKRNTLITNFKENQRNLNYRCESTHRRREAWDGHGGERSDAVGGILVRGSSNVVGRLAEVGQMLILSTHKLKACKKVEEMVASSSVSYLQMQTLPHHNMLWRWWRERVGRVDWRVVLANGMFVVKDYKWIFWQQMEKSVTRHNN